jgi:hypothetical protein
MLIDHTAYTWSYGQHIYAHRPYSIYMVIGHGPHAHRFRACDTAPRLRREQHARRRGRRGPRQTAATAAATVVRQTAAGVTDRSWQGTSAAEALSHSQRRHAGGALWHMGILCISSAWECLSLCSAASTWVLAMH